jgi:AraC-like DNA-binding protein
VILCSRDFADILLIQTIAGGLNLNPSSSQAGSLPLATFRIGRAITLIHLETARPWTVGSLATEVAMSRSSFADRFTQMLGEPVMRYVARWRMYTALTILRQERVDIGELATQLGYTSEAAFSRTFKRVIGMTAWHRARKSMTDTGRRVLRRLIPGLS